MGILPIASSTTILLGLLGVGISEAMLPEETGDMLGGDSSAVGEASVVLVVELVGASH